MSVRFDFSNIVRSSLCAGQRRFGALRELHDTARGMADELGQQISKDYRVPAHVVVRSSSLRPNNGHHCHYRELTLTPRTFTLLVEQKKSGDHLVVAAYRPDSSTCYPCTVLNGTQCIICSNIGQFRSGLKKSIDASAMAIGGFMATKNPAVRCARCGKKRPMPAKKKISSKKKG